MSITDVLSRISQIQQQLEQLSPTSTTASTGATTSTSGDGSTTTPTTASATGATDFANALAQAQTTGATSSSYPTVADSEFGTVAGGTTADGVTTPTTDLLSGGSAIGTSTALTGASTTAALPTDGSGQLTSDQQQFAQTLSADTGLNPGVVSAWLLSEESGSAAQGRQAAGNNDWLNVGYTGSGTYGASDSVWSDPVAAANATAGWLKGENTVPGYGTASSSIQGILQSVGQSPQAQISALQDSGWASSGYPNLPGLYSAVSG